MIVILWSCVIGYGITLKLNKSKYKICYYFMDNSMIFQFLYITVLNYRYFHTDSSTFFKIKNVGKIKNVKNAFFINVYYNYDAPHAMKIFGTTPTTAVPNIFHGLLFWLTLWMCVENLKSVALPVPKLIGGSQKIGVVPDYAHTFYPLSPALPKTYMPTIHTSYLCALVFPRFSIAILSWGCKPPNLGKGRP